MRIVLINPVESETRGYQNIGNYMPQLGLQVLARQTPAEHTIDIIDEVFGQNRTRELLESGRYDLVGITAYTSQATRAYELAIMCRRMGLPCVMGGPHAWAEPDEAAQYFDSVVVGEADTIWPAIIADAAAGKLQARYKGSRAELKEGLGSADQSRQPINGAYGIGSIQTSRGCPVGCDYCSVTSFSGAKIRRRPIAEIIEEWNRTPNKFLFVVDDNFFGVGREHAAWAKELLRAIIKHGKKRLWFSQTTINMGSDREAVRLAYKAGCRGMLIGFESFNTDNLKECGKMINSRLRSRYRELVDAYHRGGIAVFGAFIVGADHDDEDTVADTLSQAVRLGVDIIQITNLTPLPGTKLYQQYISDDRIFANKYPDDWKKYTFIQTVYHPRKMTAKQLDDSLYELRHAAANHNWVWKRTLKSLWRTRSFSTAVFVHNVNMQFAQLAQAVTSRDTERSGILDCTSDRMEKIRRAMAFSAFR